MQRILFVTPSYPPESSGPATYVSNIRKLLERRGYKTFVISINNYKIEPDENTKFIHFYRIRKLGIRKIISFIWSEILLLLEICKISLKWKPDIIYAQDPVATGLPSLIVSKLFRKPLLLKVVGDFSWEFCYRHAFTSELLDNFQFKNPLISKLFRPIQSIVARQSYAVITPSKYLKKIVEQWRVPNEKIKVIYNAIEIPNKVSEFDLKVKNNIVLNIARLEKWKNVDAVIISISKLNKVTLVVVGDGAERSYLENLSKKLNANVIFLGNIPHEKIFSLMKKAKVLVLVSYYEGLSHVLVEACYMGLPIIASNVGGNPEVVINGKNGFLVEPNDVDDIATKINLIINNPNLESKFRENCKKISKEFTWEENIKRLEKILQKFM